MDDRHLASVSFHRVVRACEFSRLGKSVMCFAYERIVPIRRAVIPTHTLFSDSRRGSAHRQDRARKAGA